MTVLTGIPNYPTGKFFEGYDYTHRRREMWSGVEIIRVPLIPRGSNSIGMVANYLSFVLSGRRWVRRTDVRADLVYTFEVSPMTQALVGVWYAKRYHVPHYLYVTDLWPENVESVTGIHSKVLINALQRMCNYIYKNTNYILTCSQSFVGKICRQNIDAEKIEYWPQYAEDFYKPLERKGNLIVQDGILNIVFAGNVGYAQGLGILVEAAERLRRENIRARFNIIGDGRYLPELQKQVKKGNISDYFNFISRQPAEKVPQYLAYADVLLITLSKSDVFSITIPAKTQSCMACGKPILLSADGEVQDIIRESNAGLCSDAEDIEGFVTNIKTFISMSEKHRGRLSANALLYSQTYFNKKKLLDRLDEIFLA